MTAVTRTSPTISVIVPVYNVETHVFDAITSLRGQSWQDFEAIVVDDGSTDDSPARLRAAIDGDPRFQVIRQENRGLSAARNVGLDRARGEFIAFLDSDDRLAPDFLACLHRGLGQSGADWAVCAIRFTYPDGGSTLHSAIHGAADLAGHPAPRLHRLQDWRAVIRHFPSAWNKLYRRALIGDLRFDEGTYYEDHSFFQRLAARTDALLHIPEPLYLHSRGRPGQITVEDSERVFEQFDVLETLSGLIGGAGKTGGPEALERLASRLVYERSITLRDPDRRGRFARASAAFFERHGLRWQSDWDPALSSAWHLEMQDQTPLSVVIPWDGQEAPLRDTLTALKTQSLLGWELCLIVDHPDHAGRAEALAHEAGLPTPRCAVSDAGGVGAARNLGRDMARAAFVVFLDAGDALLPDALNHWVDMMLRHGADLGISAFRSGLKTGPVHSGFHDAERRLPHGSGPMDLRAQDAVAIHAHPSARIFRLSFLQEHGITFGTDLLSEWQFTMAAAQKAAVSLYFPHPWTELSEAAEARRLWTAPATAAELIGVIDTLASNMPECLPGTDLRRLFARACWERRHFSAMTQGQASEFDRDVLAIIKQRGFDRLSGPFDPYLDAPLRAALGAPAPIASPPIRRHTYATQPSEEARRGMTSFYVRDKAVFRYRAGFGAENYANISFHDDARENILFHLSLRASDGRAVCNRRNGTQWAEEVAAPVDLANGAEVELIFAPPRLIVRINGVELFRFGGRLRRGPFPNLRRIGFVDFQGGVIAPTIDGAEAPSVGAQKTNLSLSHTFELRGTVMGQSGGLSLDIEGMEHAPGLITYPSENGSQLLRAVLPGRAWITVGDHLNIRLCSDETGSVLEKLSLSRAEALKRIEVSLTQHDLRGDAFAGAQMVEHVRFAELYNQLSAPARARLREIAIGMKIISFLDEGVRDSLPTPIPAPPDLTPLHDAMRRTSQALQGGKLRLALDQTDLPMDLARRLFVALVEPCILHEQFETLMDWADMAGFGSFDSNGDPWHDTSVMPFLFRRGRLDLVHGILADLTEAPDDVPLWISTPAIAWLLRATESARHLDASGRAALLAAICGFLASRQAGYWERNACSALRDAFCDLLGRRGYHTNETARQITRSALALFGLSPGFWAQLSPQVTADDPQLAAGKAAFDRVAQALEKHNPPDQSLVAALDQLEQLGVAAAARARRELLGPSGMLLQRGQSAHPSDLATRPDPAEAMLRHLAFPGMADPQPDAARLMARALPAFYRETGTAPYLAAQQSAVAAAQILLADPYQSGAFDEFRSALPVLAEARSGHVGIAMALALVHGLMAREATDRARMVIELLGSVMAQMDQSAVAAVAQAPAVRMAALALSVRDNALARQALELVGSTGHCPDLPQTPPELPSAPFHNTVMLVFSCRAYLDSRIPALRTGWLEQLKALGIAYMVVVGDGDGRLEGDVLHLDAPDDYEGLPDKTLAAIQWVHAHTGFTHLVKVDDDCFLNVRAFFGDFAYRKFDYYGRTLRRSAGEMDRAWHCGKSTSERGRLELDKSPEPSTYADGGSGYALSRTAMRAALEAAQSPEGRYLRQLSFMEDKLLGDLLALAGISPASEDYRITIRRRMGEESRPVARWVNSFDASQAIPVKLVHLDEVGPQQQAVRDLDSLRVRPRKIWPSFQPLRLGYQSNALELISDEARLQAAREVPVAVVACLRNERFMLPHFLAHYRALGVESFLIADNCSDDGTLAYLADQSDVALFSVDTDYSLSQYGVAWQQALISAFRVNRWSLLADADELLTWQRPQHESLPALLSGEAFADADAARVFMLDLYPKGSLDEAEFLTGDPFAETGYVDRVPFLDGAPGRGPFSDAQTWTSAVRHRLMPGSRPDLFVAQKLALLRYRPWMRLSAGLHYGADMRLAKRELLFGHFKYNADFRLKAQAEVARGQHFNDAEEYRKYLSLMSEGREILFDPDVSVRWEDCPFVRARMRFDS